MLLWELNRLFADVEYPGDGALGISSPSEWDSMLRRLRGKNWRAVTVDDFDAQGGLEEGVQALSLKAFIYYLPGLVRIALSDQNSRYAVSHALLSMFTWPDNLNRTPDQQNRVIAALSPARRSFLISFLEEMQLLDSCLCSVLVDSAKTNLRAGNVTPYQQADVDRWVALAMKQVC